MRRAARLDATQRPIVDALVECGCLVLDLTHVGGGCPDLLVKRPSTGLLRLLEVKTSAGRLRPGQVVFREVWGVSVAVVRTPEEALQAMGVMA